MSVVDLFKATERLNSTHNNRQRLWQVIYVVGEDRDGACVKIGITASLDARLKALQTGSPVRLIIHYASVFLPPDLARDLEGVIHENLHPWRLSGEWFDYPVKEAVGAVKIVEGIALMEGHA